MKAAREERIILFADEFAQEAHSGVFRKRTNLPYVEHPRAVAQILSKKLSKHLPDLYIFISVALLHDVKEDNISFYTSEFLGRISKVANAIEINLITKAIDAISKLPKGEETYLQYLQRVAVNIYAKEVKICDLIHNMSNLEPSNLKDKYEMALHFLLNV